VSEPARALIYVVEDELAVAQLLVRSLQEYGFEVRPFHDGASVLRRLLTERPDLCIVDLGLPDIEGIELVREITRRHDCGLLILTGRGHMADG